MAHDKLSLLVFLMCASLGCDTPKGDTPKGAPSSSAPAPASAAPTSAPVQLEVEPFGAAVVVIKAPSGKKDTKALARAFSGSLTITPEDLTGSRGTVAVDPSSLTAHGLGDDAQEREATARLRGLLDGTARFTVRSIDRVSEKNVFDAPRDGRPITLEATGDLELHGVKVEKKLSLALTFTMTGGAVSRVTVRPASPLVVSLREHGIGTGDAGLGSDEAVVTFEVAAAVKAP